MTPAARLQEVLQAMTSLAADDPGSLDRLVDIVPAPAPWWPHAAGWFLVGAALLFARGYCQHNTVRARLAGDADRRAAFS